MINKYEKGIEILEAIKHYENMRALAMKRVFEVDPFMYELLQGHAEHMIDIYNRCIQRLCLRLYYHENPQMKVKL